MLPNKSNIQMLRLGQQPSISESRLIHATVNKNKSELAEIDKEISRAIADLDRLRSRREDLKTTIKEHVALVAPVRGLPPELLCKIFKLCLPELPLLWKRNSECRREILYIPLLLAQINSMWRSVCLSTPHLWATITVNIKKGSSLDKTTNLLQTYLHRSRDYPLTLTFSIAAYRTAEKKFIPILELAMAHSNRWKDIAFELPLSLHLKFSPIRGRLPLLKVLGLSMSFSVIHLEPITFYEEAPQLKEVALSETFSVPMAMVPLPWHQLTALYSQREALEDFFSLRRTSNLTSCRLWDYSSSDAELDLPPLAMAVPPLEYLSAIKIHACRMRVFDLIFSSLSLPALHSLDVTAPDDLEDDDEIDNDNVWPHTRFNAFLEQASNLQSLTLDVPLTSADVAQCLSFTPRLVEVNINMLCPLRDDIIEAICYGPTRSLPRLTSVHLSGRLQFSTDALLTMIKSRFDNGVFLEHVEKGEAVVLRRVFLKYTAYSPEPELVEGLQMLQDQGLTTFVSHPDRSELVNRFYMLDNIRS